MDNTAVHATSVQRSKADYVTTNTTQWWLHKKHTTSTTGDCIRNNGRAYMTHAAAQTNLRNSFFIKTATDWNHLDNITVHATSFQRFKALAAATRHQQAANAQSLLRCNTTPCRLLDEAVYISSSSFLKCPQSCWYLFWHFRWCSRSPHFSSGHKS